MKILIACEYSGRVREAFRALGHDVISADFEAAEDGSPHHYQGDCFDLIGKEHFDLMIAHPPCTYLSVSGLHWNTRGVLVGGRPRVELTEDALAFVKRLMAAPIARIAIENPVSCISSRIRKPDQTIQPWHYGEDASKATCLWLKGLPKLTKNPLEAIAPRGWRRVVSAADMLECECCGEPFCPECNEHYTDCSCYGPTQDGVFYKMKDGVLFGTEIDPPPAMRWANQTDSGQNKLGPSPDRWKERSRTYQGIANALAEQWGIE